MKNISYLNKEKWKCRDSNIELMRIVCLTMIVAHHMIIDSLFSVPQVLKTEGSISGLLGSAIILNGFCYVAVNCFILISGYFGIKFKLRGVYKLYLFCVFYSFIRFLISGGELDKQCIYSIVLPFSHTSKWFITCYIILYLLSPLLNKAIENLKKNEYVLVLIVLTISNLYFGFLWKKYNADGYNVAQFVYLYFIGGYLREYIDINTIKSHTALCGYIVCALIFGGVSIISHYVQIPIYRSLAYNNPFILFGSIFFFILFLKIKFKSTIINWIASGAFAIYLAPEMPWRTYASDFIISHNNVILLIILCILYALSKSIIVLLVDKIRQSFFEYPILKLFDRICKNVSLLH